MKKIRPVYAACLFLAAALLLSPWSGNFPLNDDWIYALPVKNLLAGGGLQLFDTLKTQLLQTAWGAAWAWPLGFSFGALRLSTLAAGTAAVWLFGRLLLRAGAEPEAAFLGAVCLAFNPLFFTLSLTFMTEVPYLLAALLAVYLFSGRGAGRDRSLWPASLCAMGATLIRPTGLLLPAAFSLRLFSEGKPGWRRLAELWLPAISALAGWLLWMWAGDSPLMAGASAGIGAETAAMWSRPANLLAQVFVRASAGAFLYGLFLLPFSAALVSRPGFFRELLADRRAAAAAGAGAALCLLNQAISGPFPVPGFGNYLYKTGLGYVTIYGYTAKACGPLGLHYFWPAATFLSALSAGVLAAGFYRLRGLNGPARDCAAAFGLQFLFLLVAPRFFDRYFVYLLPLGAAAAALAAQPVSRRAPALLAASFLAVFSWAGTGDYLAWNAAKWELSLAAAHYGVPPEKVAGGADYDAWYNYETNTARLRASRGGGSVGEWEWLDLGSKKAMVGFSVPPSRKKAIMARAVYPTPLAPFSGGTLYMFALPPSADGAMR